jgi:hypothetical protein
MPIGRATRTGYRLWGVAEGVLQRTATWFSTLTINATFMPLRCHATQGAEPFAVNDCAGIGRWAVRRSRGQWN